MGENSASIIVHRPATVFRDRLRKYGIEIDGVHVGHVGNGEQLHFPVPPGVHHIRAAIDWTGSPVVRLSLAPGQTARLTVELAGSIFEMWQAFTAQGYLKLTAD